MTNTNERPLKKKPEKEPLGNVQTPRAELVVAQPTEKEVSLEARRLAEKTICQTLELDDDSSLDNFSDKLTEAVGELPRYQELKVKLDSLSSEAVGYDLFQELKRANDEPIDDDTVPVDGVLVSSMRSGKLECAGRALMASTYLQERNIDHMVVTAPGHSFLLLEQNQDTLAYFDLNNNLYFTFPKEALAGYQGKETISECRLGEYTPREEDVTDGLNTPFTYFITIPPQEGISRQYLSNAQAALNGNPEFAKSNITPNPEASRAVDDIEKDLLGEKDQALDSFLENSEGNIRMTDIQGQADRKLVGDLLAQHSEQDGFAQAFAQVVQGELGNRLVYLKNASEDTRIEYGCRVWEFLQSSGTFDDISRMQ